MAIGTTARTFETCTCERCKHQWEPRTSPTIKLPLICPKCKSAGWNRPKTRYAIQFDGWAPEPEAGYNCWDFFDEQGPGDFESIAEARVWIKKHYRGPDSEGVNALFSVTEKEKA